MAAVEGDLIQNVAYNQKVNASSSSIDGNHLPSFVVDGTTDTFWQSDGKEIISLIQINLDSIYTISKIDIHWIDPPKQYQIKLLPYYPSWETVYSTQSQTLLQPQLSFSIVPIKIRALQIIMHNPINGHTFSIAEIKIKNNMQQILLKSCLATNNTNSFIIDSSELIDLTVKEKIAQAKQLLA